MPVFLSDYIHGSRNGPDIAVQRPSAVIYERAQNNVILAESGALQNFIDLACDIIFGAYERMTYLAVLIEYIKRSHRVIA